ncbi:MAG: methyl-accepting chemotaxis protein [Dechloromonas sp.]|nr:methyl-accepting chemotaxis protein [Dechloromonas sp.]
MGTLAKLRLSSRMQLLVGLMLIGLLVLCVTALFQLKESMLEERKQKTRNLVEVGLGIVTHHHKLVAAGTLSDDEAKKAAREALRGVRYASNDYYFILDGGHRYILVPPKPENEGKDVSETKDANGKFLIREIVSAGKAGGGFVDYWFPRAGETQPAPKLSYVAPFAPWDWVIGTGIYVDDIDNEFKRGALLLGGISLALLLVLGIIGFLITRSVIQQLGGEPTTVSTIMQRVAEGDLTAGASSARNGSLLHSLDGMVASLRQMIGEINRDANSLVTNAEKIARASVEVAKAADQQSESTSAMAAAIEELTVSSNHISDSARETSAETREAVRLSDEGTARVGQAAEAIQLLSGTISDVSTRIHTLEERANQVSSIANVIKDIAGQTNLLALNAAIEAARAGEQGRGFAVVADEVRKLAERTSLATTEIESMIGAIQSDTAGAVEAMNAALPEVQQGVTLALSASDSLRHIEEGARRTLDRVGEVADSTHEQSTTSTAIAQRVEEIANMVEETTVTIRGTAATAQELESIANNLKVLVGRFRV